jgi:hypothetical protein
MRGRDRERERNREKSGKISHKCIDDKLKGYNLMFRSILLSLNFVEKKLQQNSHNLMMHNKVNKNGK